MHPPALAVVIPCDWHYQRNVVLVIPTDVRPRARGEKTKTGTITRAKTTITWLGVVGGRGNVAMAVRARSGRRICGPAACRLHVSYP
jgi:hypothetical protein